MPNKKTLTITLLIIASVFGIAVAGFILFASNENSRLPPKVVNETIPPPQLSPTPSQKNAISEIERLGPSSIKNSEQSEAIEKEPTKPQPPALNNSDAPFLNALAQMNHGSELASLFKNTNFQNEEIIRKIVRAVYGLSQGRVVRQYRPMISPKGEFLAKKIGQQIPNTGQELYRIDRENYARYENYISLLSAINGEAMVSLYRFYLPVFEQAYQELGLGEGSFHQSLLKAIDMLLTSPNGQDAHLLIQPSVFYKFSDGATEKLLPAQKLMIRMGQENRETLSLELKNLKQMLLTQGKPKKP
ncbi:MAG: DUF3014 domain-containing protein [Agarilytica sp.]